MCAWPGSSAALEQAARLAGPHAQVTKVQVLLGGTHARTSLIQTDNPELQVVLRQFPPGDDAASHEIRVLRALDGLGGLAPRLLASNIDGAASQGSWLLISRLPGIADITPDQPAAAAEQLGQALARIHATYGWRLTGLPSVLDRPSGSRGGFSGPAASVVSASWDWLARAPHVLTHCDFWSGNAVWDGHELTGVVDWPGGALGPRGFDVGWCRLDLYLLHGERIADRFLAAYQAASQVGLPDLLLWDLWAVAQSHQIVETWMPNYCDLGRTDLTAAELRNRHSAWTQRLLARRRDQPRT
jgi:aminoglycoside phosphotransferase (APT) family kinase protein